LPGNTTKSELLFIHLILRALEMGGRCVVIVPDGVLFGTSRAHVEVRRKIIEENRLDGVVSMPGGVFKPYAGVSTAVLLFTRGARSERIWFYDMAHDGYSLDDKRQPVAENDIPDILECWGNRRDPAFQAEREARLAALQAQVAPLKAARLRLLGEVNRLTFESAIAPGGDEGSPARATLDAAKKELADLAARISPLQRQIERLSRQFWVTKAQVKANRYDLSVSRYRQVAQDEAYYEAPQVTMERLLTLERLMQAEIKEIEEFL
jgi:type I restriction enzyme M protein